MAKNPYWTYPEDTTVKNWLALSWTVAESIWKHLDEYADPDAKGFEKLRYDARGRGIQQASFRLHDLWKDPSGLDTDELNDAVAVYYSVAMACADFIDEEKNGGVNGDGLRFFAEAMVAAVHAWSEAPRTNLTTGEVH